MANIDLHDTVSVGTDAPRIAFRVLQRCLSSGPPDITITDATEPRVFSI